MKTLYSTRKVNQDTMVLRHLMAVGNLTAVEASNVYKIRSLTSVIARLRRTYEIVSETKRDLLGQRYVRYHYKGLRSA